MNTQYTYNQDYTVHNTRLSYSTLEWVVVVLCLLLLLMSTVWGFWSQGGENRDKQRQQDIAQVEKALINYYRNSSEVPSQRIFPIANCSQNINEVDYELTLRVALTGQNETVSNVKYIPNEDFPTDSKGTYSQKLEKRKVPYRCTQRLTAEAQNGGPIYSNFESCNFRSASKPFYRFCYIYTSSSNGDTFQLGYYSETRGKYIVRKGFRENPVVTEVL
jgi:type II secretory pathway pseudopilin PulG